MSSDPSDDILAGILRASGRRATPSAEDRDTVLRAAGASWRRAVRARRRRRWVGAIAAGAVVVTLVVSMLGRRPGDGARVVTQASLVRGEVWMLAPEYPAWRRVRAGEPVIAGARLRTAATTGAALSLSDGASIRLRSATTLRFESRNGLRLDSGAVYVDTGAGGNSRPIRVHTEWGTVNDLGTVFEVEWTPGELRVRVREGRIRLERRGEHANVESRAGEELAIDAGGFTQRHEYPTSGGGWAWAEALAVAPQSDDQPLLQFLEWVARETGRQLRFDAADTRARAAAVRLHGSPRNLGPLDALSLMLATTDFEYRLEGETEILIRRRHPESG
jgi:ferric-dicitrate binding protein FerR (iron transport regulator)